MRDNKKIIKILCFVFLGVLAIAGVISAFVLNYNIYPPTAPYVLDDGSNVFFSTQINENYQGYRFKISAPGEADVVIDSQTNTISSQQLTDRGLLVGKQYGVSVCYLGETEGSNSPYSKLSQLTLQQYLERPVVTQGEGQFIEWQPVEKAEYYSVYYKDAGEYKYISTQLTTFDFSKFAGGEKEFYVIAGTKKKGYKDSNQSNVLKVDHVYHLQPLEQLALDQSSLVLSFKAKEKISHIKLYIEEQEYIVKLSEPINMSGLYRYSFSVASTIYEEGMTLGVAPYSENPLSAYVGDIIYL